MRLLESGVRKRNFFGFLKKSLCDLVRMTKVYEKSARDNSKA